MSNVPKTNNGLIENQLINRELSWLQFNDRVLEEARDRTNPLFERVKFLSIAGTNLDEFFMVRVAGLFNQIKDGYDELSADGLSSEQQLERVVLKTKDLLKKQNEAFNYLKKELRDIRIFYQNPWPDKVPTFSKNKTVIRFGYDEGCGFDKLTLNKKIKYNYKEGEYFYLVNCNKIIELKSKNYLV